jgi:hypothetical protein
LGENTPKETKIKQGLGCSTGSGIKAGLMEGRTGGGSVARDCVIRLPESRRPYKGWRATCNGFYFIWQGATRFSVGVGMAVSISNTKEAYQERKSEGIAVAWWTG